MTLRELTAAMWKGRPVTPPRESARGTLESET